MTIFTQIKSNFLTSHLSISQRINAHALAGKPFFLLVDFEMQQQQFYEIHELEEAGIFIEFPRFQTKHKKQVAKEAIQLSSKAMTLDNYKSKFDIVMNNLRYGNSFLTNLTAATPIKSQATLTDIFHAAEAKYKVFYKNEWVCFSPEIFIQIEQGKIKSFPMKGTIDAAAPNAHEILLNDKKEIAEHYTIVDLIRNDLSKVASNVNVKRFRYFDEIKTQHKTLLQVSSEIEGTLSANYKEQFADILFNLLPAGSISGAPKTKTLEIIQEAEQMKRGFYTGVAFYFDGTNLDSCVLIRFLENTANGLFYRSGGGITIQSEYEKEYEELLNKIYVPRNS